MRSAVLFILLAGFNLVQGQGAVPPKPGELGAAFRLACFKGNLAEVSKMFDAGAPLEERDLLGRTPLFLACHGDPDVVRFLLARGAKVDVIDNEGDTTMCRACQYGDLASAQMLLAAGADLNRVNNNGRTPLILAAREGHEQLVAFLIAQHVDINHEGIGGGAILLASYNDHFSIVKMLLEAGARVTPSPEAISWKYIEPIVAAAAHTNDLPLVDLLLDHKAGINEADGKGRSVLMYAVQSGHPETILYLVQRGADVNAQDDDGATPLMLAINYKTPTFLQDLVKHGAKLELRDQKGRTALMWACRLGLPDHIRALVDSGADINAIDDNGNTPLVYAANRGDLADVQYFKDKGAKITEPHIIARGSPTVALKPAQSWALAVGAIYAQYNGDNPEVIGYENHDTVYDIKNELKEDWDVTDKASFLKVVQDLATCGQRAEMQKNGAKLAALDDDKFNELLCTQPLPSEQITAAKATRAIYRKWGARAGLAWDLCRRANMINSGCAAHYVTEDEAWLLLLDNARQIQAGFHSWQEMSDNFLDGREIWAGKRDPGFTACAELLLNPKDPESPWSQLPWATDLSGI